MIGPTLSHLTPEALQGLLGSVTLMTLLAVAYGALMRFFKRAAAAQVVLGALFGGVALVAMLGPLRLAEGLTIDLRTMPVVLAGAFLGLPGAAVTALMALTARVWMGGVGVVAESASIVVSALLGLAWAGLVGRRPGREVRNALILAMASPLALTTYFLLPWDLAWLSVTTAWPVMVPIKLVGVLLIGSLLERERMMGDEARQLGLAATRDPLTGLLNRRGFEEAMARVPARGGGLALLVLDLDHFKRVNDTHGHTAGDAVLQALGARLRDALGPQDVVARFGGEEMIVFLSDAKSRAAMDAAARLCAGVRGRPFILPGGAQVAVTASVGGVWASMIGISGTVRVESLMILADAALYAAKDAGRDCWRFDIGGCLAGGTVEPADPARVVGHAMSRCDAIRRPPEQVQARQAAHST